MPPRGTSSPPQLCANYHQLGPFNQMFAPPALPPRLKNSASQTELFHGVPLTSLVNDDNLLDQTGDWLNSSLFVNKELLQNFGIPLPRIKRQNHEQKQPPSPSYAPLQPEQKTEQELFYEKLFCAVEEESTDVTVPTWDLFLTGTNNPPSEYILEQSRPQFEERFPVFNALVDNTSPDPLPPITPTYFIQCLMSVVCGQQSQLFRYNPKSQCFYVASSFHSTNPEYRLAGLSGVATDSIVQAALQAGSRMVRLKYTCDVIYNSANKGLENSLDSTDHPVASPILVAFANNITRVLYVIESHINQWGNDTADTNDLKRDEPSILACYNVIREPIKVINMTAILLGCDNLAKALALNRLPSSWKLLNSLYSRCLRFQDGNTTDPGIKLTPEAELASVDEYKITQSSTSGSLLYHLFRSMLHHSVSQWLLKLDAYVGLGSAPIGSKGLVSYTTYTHDVDMFLEIDNISSSPRFVKEVLLYKVNTEKVPDFMSKSLAQLCADIANCLVLISNHSTTLHTSYPFTSYPSVAHKDGTTLLEVLQYVLRDEKPKLSWSLSFQELKLTNTALSKYVLRAKSLFYKANRNDESSNLRRAQESRDVQSVTFESDGDTTMEDSQDDIISVYDEFSLGEEGVKKSIQRDAEDLLLKISTPPTVSNVFATLMPNHNQQETSGSGKSLHDEVGLSGTQIPFHVINTLSIGSVLSVQSQLLHRLLLQNVYGSPSFDFNTLPSRAHLPDNDCDLLNHMTLLRQIMLLGSGEIVVSLEDMILGKDLSSFLAGFPQLAQPHSVINFDETESAKFGPFGSLNLCTNPYLYIEDDSVDGNKRSKWPPASPHVHYALSDCVDLAIKNIGISETIRKRHFMNVGIKSSGNLGNSWSIATSSSTSHIFRRVDGLKADRFSWLYPLYVSHVRDDQNHQQIQILSTHPKFALGASTFLKMTYTPPKLVSVIVTRQLVKGCYEKAFTWLVQVLHVRRVVRDIHYSLTIETRNIQTNLSALHTTNSSTDEEMRKRVQVIASLCWNLVEILYSHIADRSISTFWDPWMQKLDQAINYGNPSNLTLHGLIESHEVVVTSFCSAMFIPLTSSSKFNNLYYQPRIIKVRSNLEALLQTLLDFSSYVSSSPPHLFHLLQLSKHQYLQQLQLFEKIIKDGVIKVVRSLSKMEMEGAQDAVGLQLLQMAKELEYKLQFLLY